MKSISSEALYKSITYFFKPLSLPITDVVNDSESQKYAACSFKIKNYTVAFRLAHSTPCKEGQFVTLWKRNKDNITAPYALEDGIDFFIIMAQKGEFLGQFIFPASLLQQQGIISSNNEYGKRGIRIYPPWDTAPNKQAATTQRWQIPYFFSIFPGEEGVHASLNKMFNP